MTCPSCTRLRAELAEVRAALDLEVSRRTEGGSPLKVNWNEWTNEPQGTPVSNIRTDPGGPL